MPNLFQLGVGRLRAVLIYNNRKLRSVLDVRLDLKQIGLFRFTGRVAAGFIRRSPLVRHSLGEGGRIWTLLGLT